MDALSRCMLHASQQFVALADPEILNSRANNLLAATMIALVASMAVVPTDAKAWGETVTGDALPQQSASQWGGMLGGVLGKALGASVGGSQASEVSRMVQTVVSGVGQEVGRNLGSQAAQAPYAAAKAAGSANTGSGLGGYGRGNFARMPAYEKDHLDTLGLRAIFSNGEAAKAVQTSSAQLLLDRSYSTTRDFEMALRASSDRGFDVRPWTDARGALQQPLRAVPEAKFAELASGMAQQLQRPGGPGFTMNGTGSTNSLDNLRSRMQNGQGLTYQQVSMPQL